MTDGMKYFLGAVGFTTLFLAAGCDERECWWRFASAPARSASARALGATSATILRQFFVETLIVVFISGALGFTVAFASCGLVDLLDAAIFFPDSSRAGKQRCYRSVCWAQLRLAPRCIRQTARLRLIH